MSSLFEDRSDREIGAAGVAAAVLGPLAVSGLLVAFRSELFPTNAALVLVLAVLGAAIMGGRIGGALGALVAALCFDFFFTHPYYSFTINRRDDVETTVVLLAVGLIVGEVVVRLRRSRRVAKESRREVEQIQRIAELAAGSGPESRLITIVEREVTDLLGARGARFEPPPYPTALPRIGHGVLTVPPGGNGTASPPVGPHNEVELLVCGRGRELGRLVLVLPRDSSGATLPSRDRALAVALVDQLGAVLAAT
jgi:MFS family permease